MPSLEPQQGLAAGQLSTASLAITEAISQLQLSPPPQTPVRRSVDLAVSVLTTLPLLATIGSFQEDPVASVATYKTKVLSRKQAKKEGAQGSLVRVAITRGDLRALQMIHTARLLNPAAAERPELSFQAAMDVAVCEGQTQIIQWLHARALDHPVDIQGRPETRTLLKILRDSRMDIVHCLFDQHDHQCDELFLSLLTNALRRSQEEVEGPSTRAHGLDGPAEKRTGWALSLLQLFVQQRPALHDRLLTLAAEVGSRPAVSYMLSPRSGVDTTTIAMLPSAIAAAQGGHRELIEMLFGVKRPDEVIDAAVLREQLRSVGDAGALQLLLSVAAQRDPVVQSQLDAEQKAASALFGFGPSTSSGPTTKGTTARRSKAGRR